MNILCTNPCKTVQLIYYFQIKEIAMSIKDSEIAQDLYDIYDYYCHSKIDRRQFIDRISVYAVGGLTVPSILAFLMPNYVDAQQIKSDDPRVDSSYVTYDSPKGGGEIKGLLALPQGNIEKLPGIVVVHENRGLNPYIEDVTRRAGLANFIAIGPDALTPLGGYPGNDDDGRLLQRKRDRHEMLEDFMAAFEYLRSHPQCNGHVGVVGFCFGGWISNMMAVRLPELKASVPFYGGQPDDEDVIKIQAPLMLQYGALDKRVNAGWPDYEAALKKNNKKYIAHMYPEVNHGFHNNTTPRYNKEAAELAWERTIAFFSEHLV